jgi:glutamate synthase (NADPH/NADH) small chain
MDFKEIAPGFTEEEAIEEAKGCLSCKKPKCIEACPTNQDVPGYIAKIAEGDFKGALRIIMKDNPFPGTCGRVCPHPCQSQCIRGKKGTSTSIAKLKRFVADNTNPYELGIKPGASTGKRVCIVGSGPAGLSCAYFLALMGHEAYVRECNKDTGGMPAVAIPEFRLPKSVVEREMDFIKSMSIEIEGGAYVAGVDELKNCDAMFLGIGAHNPRELEVEGAGLEGVEFGSIMLKHVKRGEPPRVGKNVVIIGGGDVAIDTARTALRLGGENVTIVYRRSEAEMPAYIEDLEEALTEGVKIHYLASPVKIVGEGGRVKAVEFIENELGECDESGRCRPVPVKGSEFQMEADTVLLAIGQGPHLGFIEGEKELLSDRNTVAADVLTTKTNAKGIFAGGDCVTGPASVVEAIAAGKRAAIAIDDYLKEEEDV